MAVPAGFATPVSIRDTDGTQPGPVIVRPTVTLTATPDYSATDVVGGIITLSSVMSSTGRPAMLRSVVAKDDGGQAPALTLLFFRATPAGGTYTDNGTFVWGTSDLSNLVGVVKIVAGDWYTVISNSQVALGGIDLLMGSATTDLYLLIIADATWNAGATTDLTLEFGFEQK